MTTTTTPTTTFDLAGFSRAIADRDAEGQGSAYADDAELITVDADHGPSSPLVAHGRAAILEQLREVCERDMTHEVTAGLVSDDRLAIQVACRYPEGARVLCSAVAELRGGRIIRQTTVQAWDA